MYQSPFRHKNKQTNKRHVGEHYCGAPTRGCPLFCINVKSFHQFDTYCFDPVGLDMLFLKTLHTFSVEIVH